METTSILLAALLGLGLSASTGLNTFLPLLLLSAAARFNIAGVELGQKFDWLSSDTAIICLICFLSAFALSAQTTSTSSANSNGPKAQFNPRTSTSRSSCTRCRPRPA